MKKKGLVFLLLLTLCTCYEVELDCLRHLECSSCTKISSCNWAIPGDDDEDEGFCTPGNVFGPSNHTNNDYSNFFYLQCGLGGMWFSGNFSYSVIFILFILFYCLISSILFSFINHLGSEKDIDDWSSKLKRNNSSVELYNISSRPQKKQPVVDDDLEKGLEPSNNITSPPPQIVDPIDPPTKSPISIDPIDPPDYSTKEVVRESCIIQKVVSSPSTPDYDTQLDNDPPQEEKKKEIEKPKAPEAKLSCTDPSSPDFDQDSYKAMMIARYEEEQRQNAIILAKIKAKREADAKAAMEKENSSV